MNHMLQIIKPFVSFCSLVLLITLKIIISTLKDNSVLFLANHVSIIAYSARRKYENNATTYV